MLSLCFLDLIDWDYNVDAPTHRPFGGSQSALCYLAVELAKLGHNVTLLSNTSKPGVVSGVTCLNLKLARRHFFTQSKFDAVIVLNGPAEFSSVRWHLPSSTKLLMWTQHGVDQPAMRGLSSRNKAKKWDHIVCVSDWHRQTVIKTFGIDAERVSVLRNAIAPAFESLFPSRDSLIATKADGLRLAYTSTPFRGLDVLLEIFPGVQPRRSKATLDVYSSMAVYQQDASSDRYRPLYDASKAIPGVKYVGSLPQPALATALSKAHVLSYPNTFAETSCISVMEALGAGLAIVTSEFGALPETAQGFARLVPYGVGDRTAYTATYRDALAQTLEAYSLADWADRLYHQVTTINRTCTWRLRALEWTRFLSQLLSARHDARANGANR